MQPELKAYARRIGFVYSERRDPAESEGFIEKQRQRDFALGIDINEAKIHVLGNRAVLLPFAGMQV